jgi:hypothetical protein
MIAVPAGVKVLVATKPVDFRKGGDGLVALVREALGHDPFSGTIFIFRSKRAPVLDPGRGRTKTGYFWAISRDDRPWGGSDPPGVVYTYAPGRGGEHATASCSTSTWNWGADSPSKPGFAGCHGTGANYWRFPALLQGGR